MAEVKTILDILETQKLTGWALPRSLDSAIGRQEMVLKDRLSLDLSYQREHVPAKVKRISLNWTWGAVGVLVVAQRPGDQNLYIVDGGHRWLAACRQDNVKELPCLVIPSSGPAYEAKLFRQINCDRKPMDALSRFRAAITEGDPVAIAVNHLIALAGYVPGNANQCLPNTIQCVGSMCRWYGENEQALRAVWPIMVNIHKGKLIREFTFAGFFYIESRISPEKTLGSDKFLKRILRFDADEYNHVIRKAMMAFGKGGPKIYAYGVLELINKGARDKVVVDTLS